jgi:hypothetical protein
MDVSSNQQPPNHIICVYSSVGHVGFLLTQMYMWWVTNYITYPTGNISDTPHVYPSLYFKFTCLFHILSVILIT